MTRIPRTTGGHDEGTLLYGWLLTAFAVNQAIQHRLGMMSVVALAWMLAAGAFALWGLLARPAWLERRAATALPWVAVGMLAVQVWQLLSVPPGVYLAPDAAVGQYHALVICVGLAAAVGLFAGGRGRPWLAAVVLAGTGLLGAWLIRSSPEPLIDTHVWQQVSLQALAAGRNPYAIELPDIYQGRAPYYPEGWTAGGRCLWGYVYMPLCLLLGLPGYLLGGDVRWSLLAAGVLTLLVAFWKGNRLAMAAGALMATSPRLLFVLEQSWTELFVVWAMALVVFCAERARRLLPVALGLLLASKQYSIVFLPLVPLLIDGPLTWRAVARLIVPAGAVAALLTVPFLLVDPSAFIRSTIQFHLASPFRPDALSLPAAWYAFTRSVPSGIWAWVGWVVAAGLAVWRLPRGAASFAGGAAAAMLPFVMLAKQAFANYYFFIAWSLLLACAYAEFDTPHGDDARDTAPPPTTGAAA